MRSSRPGPGGRPARGGILLILCIGDPARGDEGVGVHAARALSDAPLPPGARVVDGGTGGLHLLALLQGEPALVLVDGAADGLPPGTVRVQSPSRTADFPPWLCAHDPGLRDLLAAAARLGRLPPAALVTVSIEPGGPAGADLSPPVAAAVPAVVRAVRRILEG